MKTKEEILDLLSDVEVARVSTVEGDGMLEEGLEFIDLDHLDRGIQHAHGVSRREIHSVVTRNSVSDQTWHRIEDALAA